MRAPFQRVGFPPWMEVPGRRLRQLLISASLPCILPTQALALEKPLPGAWRRALAASAWTLEVGRLRPLWGARLSHRGGGGHMLSLPRGAAC